MKAENKKREENSKIKRKTKKVKRQISIFTIILWVFLVTSMITITLNSVKQKNALEITDDNWNIQLVMYDRSSDTPNEAITNLTWNVERGSETKQLCMQINYACTTGKEYLPGEIEITIPGIAKDNFSEYYRESSYSKIEYTVGADKISDIPKRYDWSYNYNSENNIYIFTNNNTVELNEHFEGTIQIVYNLEPDFRIKTDLEFKAKIKENIENVDELIAMESNVCSFHYTSSKTTYNVKNNFSGAPKTIYENLEDVIDNYYWYKCDFSVIHSNSAPIKALALVENRSEIGSKNSCIKQELPDECVMYDEDFNKLEPKENNTYYYLLSNKYNGNTPYYIGYPKSKYKVGDKITNTAELWGRYEDEEEIQKLAEDSVITSLIDFDFDYKGDLYNITKINANDEEVYKSDVNGSTLSWNMSVTAFYTEGLMDVEIGDDLLYITRENGEITKLEDNEYDFNGINIPIFKTYNRFTGKAGDILEGYNYEIWVRYSGSNEYEKYYDGITSASTEYVSLNDNRDVVGVKLILKDLDKTIYPDSKAIRINAFIKVKDCDVGGLYNFNYLQVYKKDSDGNRTLANEVNKNSYKTPSTLKIAEYDMETYGTYMQRDSCVKRIINGEFTLDTSKNRNTLTNNIKEEKYETEYEIKSTLKMDNYYVNKECIVKQYDILPSGINLLSTKDEIIDSIYSEFNYIGVFSLGFNTKQEFENYIKENTNVKIDYNYKNSGRTKISVIYNLNDVKWNNFVKNYNVSINIKLNVEIPYDSILEYGTSYKNFTYAMWNNQEYGYFSSIKDNGEYDVIASDIDEDGDTTEKVAYDYITLNITHAVSSKQAVIKQVRTDLTKGEFVSKSADVTAGSEYTYKLRVTTGANSLKDLIIYDTLETVLDSEGNDISSGWKGEFLGVDTTYAKSKGYAPVVYYSEEINPGKLTDVPEKWKEITEDTDKTKVKSICVDLRYKSDGTEMELCGNNVVFVLINMQAPDDDTIISSSNNMFSTNWRTKDPLGTVIDNVEGIYSNQINVNIYKIENEKKDIVGKKTWVDTWNTKSYRPKSVIVKLMQDGIEYKRCEVSEADEWEYEFLDVPVYKNDKLDEYEYIIEEEELPTYEAIYDGYNITNKLKTKNIEVTKVWDDNDNEKGLRPKVIFIQIYDGDKMVDSKIADEYSTDWKCTFYGLPEYRVDGSKIEYRIDEKVEKVAGFQWGGEYIEEVNFETDEEFELYKKSYVKQIVENTITNKYVDPDERIKITGTKVWEDSDNKAGKRPDSVVLQIKNGEEVVSEAVVDESINWSYEFEVPRYDEESNEISYYIDEKETPIFYEKELTDETTVTNKFVVPNDKVKIPVIKLWEDLEDKYNKRPKNIILQVYNGDKLVAESKVSEKDNWSYEFELPKYDENGNEIEYRVDEKETDENYEKRVSGYTVINKCIYEPDENITDTSDINIVLYLSIFLVALIGIIVGIIFVLKKKIVKK